ncbi:MAG: DinB family protein, partial [Flavitalea sp.]
MKITNHELIRELLEITACNLVSAKQLRSLSEKELNFRNHEKEWSILECIEHLNLYGDYYLPEIQKQLLTGKVVPTTTVFETGAIGNWFTNMMKVKEGKLKKMKSPKDKNPHHSSLTPVTIDRFIKQLESLQRFLQDATRIDLIKAKTPVSISKLIKLRLGDTLRFLVYHIERHVLQAEKVAASIYKQPNELVIETDSVIAI